MVVSQRGSLLILFLVTISVLTIMLLKGRELWDALNQRELERELIFRARQYVQAIQGYARKYVNTYPESVDVLILEKFLRKKFKEPLSESGKWRYVLRDRTNENRLLVVGEDELKSYLSRSYWVGVAPSATGKSFFVHKGKDRYEQWLFFVGDESLTQIPQFEAAE